MIHPFIRLIRIGGESTSTIEAYLPVDDLIGTLCPNQ